MHGHGCTGMVEEEEEEEGRFVAMGVSLPRHPQKLNCVAERRREHICINIAIELAYILFCSTPALP